MFRFQQVSRYAMALLAVCFGSNAFAQIAEMGEPFLQQTIAMLHHEQYDSALANCAKLRQENPANPAGYLMAASVYQTMMRLYRVRIFEIEFDSFSQRAETLAERQSKENSSSAEAWFMLGSAKGNRALHRFHQGDKIAALKDGLLAMHAMKRALKCDRSFVDPQMPLALCEYWKSKKLNVGGLFAGGQENAYEMLERARTQGRYVALDAAFTIQNLRLHDEDYQRAYEVNEQLYNILPSHPSVLYHRALICENMQKPMEALPAWDRLIARIHSFQRPSYGFLAECHLHRARILAAMANSAGVDSVALEIESDLGLAASFMERCDPAIEMEGPIENFKELRKAIKKMLNQYLIASAELSD